MKKTLLFIGLLAVILTSCHKEAVVNFSYTTTTKYDYDNDVYYVELSTINLSLYAVSYMWELEGPNGDLLTSYSESPVFKCYQTGDYELRLYAYSKNGDYKIEGKHIYISPSGGGGGTDPIDPPYTPTNFTITWLRLENIPMLDGNNGSWDTGLFGGGDPDIYFKIYNADNQVVYTSNSVEDLGSSDLPHTWTGVNTTLSYSANQHYIKFYDKDGDLDSDDLMVNCILEPSHLTYGNSTFTWVASDNSVRFVIGLSW
jgi:hypothetical protein